MFVCIYEGKERKGKAKPNKMVRSTAGPATLAHICRVERPVSVTAMLHF
jgi:hypothetical protein